MRGKHRITVQNKRIRYEFKIKRNFTIIRGDSATGKTTLVEMIREYSENGADSGIELSCDKDCVVLSGRNWETQLAGIQDSIVFIDEGNAFVSSEAFAAEIQKSDNYYVIVTREGLPNLPYSVEEIYGIRNSGKYGSLKQVYNELYHLYGQKSYGSPAVPDTVITEDSNSGYQFFQHVCEKKGYSCISAGGKSNIFSVVLQQRGRKTLVIADGAAFGSEMEKLMSLMKGNEQILLYLPESFEWLILNSGVVNDSEVKHILAAPYEYIESREYLSWERYFTWVLIHKTVDSYLKYNKKSLNSAYLQESIMGQILENMKEIDFDMGNHNENG